MLDFLALPFLFKLNSLFFFFFIKLLIAENYMLRKMAPSSVVKQHFQTSFDSVATRASSWGGPSSENVKRMEHGVETRQNVEVH